MKNRTARGLATRMERVTCALRDYDQALEASREAIADAEHVESLRDFAISQMVEDGVHWSKERFIDFLEGAEGAKSPPVEVTNHILWDGVVELGRKCEAAWDAARARRMDVYHAEALYVAAELEYQMRLWEIGEVWSRPTAKSVIAAKKI